MSVGARYRFARIPQAASPALETPASRPFRWCGVGLARSLRPRRKRQSPTHGETRTRTGTPRGSVVCSTSWATVGARPPFWRPARDRGHLQRALQRLRELLEWAWVPGFVQTDLAGAGDLEVRDPAPTLDVMAHEEQGVMPGPAAPAGARVDRDLTRRQGEDQPALAGIDPLEAQHVVKELPSSLGILGEDDRVCSGDHGGDRSAGYCSAGAGGSELSAALGRQRPRARGGAATRRPSHTTPDGIGGLH